MKTIERIAWHEAGHAYTLVRMGIEFKHVTIIPGTAYNGRVKDYKFSGAGMDALRDCCMISYAGHIAEEIYTGLNLPVDLESDDIKYANRQIDRFIKDKMKSVAFAGLVYEATKFAMKQGRDKLKIIAGELLKKRTLTYQDVAQLVA